MKTIGLLAHGAADIRGWSERNVARFGRSVRHLGDDVSLPHVDLRRIIFATNVGLGAVLALFFAFLLDLENTYWALSTIPFVMQQ